MGELLSITHTTIIAKAYSKIDTGITGKGLFIAKPSDSNTMIVFALSTSANLIGEIKTLGDVIGINTNYPINLIAENNTLHISNSLEVDKGVYITMIQ